VDGAKKKLMAAGGLDVGVSNTWPPPMAAS